MSKKHAQSAAPDERVSLAGLDPEEALRALLKVNPDAPPAEAEPPEPEPRVRDESDAA
jgi:hypothetical protein